MKISVPKSLGRLLLVATLFLLSACGQEWSSNIVDEQAGPEPLGDSFPVVEEYLKIAETPGIYISQWSKPQLVERNGQKFWRIGLTMNAFGVEKEGAAYIQNKVVKFTE